MPYEQTYHWRDMYDRASPSKRVPFPEEDPGHIDWTRAHLPDFHDEIEEHFTPRYWESSSEMAQIFEDQFTNANNRQWAKNNVTDEMISRTREITSIYPHITPGVVQALVRSNADDDIVREVSRLSAAKALQDGHYDDPKALDHLPYRSSKPRSPVRVPLAGDTFNEMRLQNDQRRRDNRTRQAGQDAIHNPNLRGLMDDLRASPSERHGLGEDRDRAEAVERDIGIQYQQQRRRPDSPSSPSSPSRSRSGEQVDQSILGSVRPTASSPEATAAGLTAQESQQFAAGLSEATAPQDLQSLQTGSRSPSGPVEPSGPRSAEAARNLLNRPQDRAHHFTGGHDRDPQGAMDESGGFFNDIGNFLRRNIRMTTAMMDQPRRVLGGSIPQAVQTALGQPNVSFTEALRDAEQGTGLEAVAPALLDRIADGTIDQGDVEDRNYLSVVLSLLNDPISLDEVDQYLQNEDGSNWFGAGDTDIAAWKADRENAVRFAENWYPDIVEAFHEDNDPYRVHASPGRIFARDRTPLSPGQRGYDTVSGIADLGFTLLGDPVAYATGASSRVSHASRVFGRNITAGEALWPRLSQVKNLPGSNQLREMIRRYGGYQGSRPLTVVEDATAQLTNSRHGQAVTNFATRNTNEREIWRAFGKKIDMATARELAAAENHAQARHILIRAAEGRSAETGEMLSRRFRQLPGSGGQIVGPISRTFASFAEGTSGGAGQALGISGLIRYSGRTPRFFGRAPMQGGINYGRNPNQGVENLERVMMNANMPKDQIDHRINQFMRGRTALDRQQVVNDAYGDISTHIVGIHRRPTDETLPQAVREANQAYNSEVERFARRLTTAYGDEVQRVRSFFADSQTGAPAEFPGTRNEIEEVQAVGGMIVELLNDNMPLPDWRRIRRLTDELELSRTFDMAREGSVSRKAYEATLNAGERIFVNTWQPLQLFRSAWGVRVNMEEVVGRLGANGMAGLSNHPMIYVGSALGGLTDFSPSQVSGMRQALGRASGAVRNRFGRYHHLPHSRNFTEAESVAFDEPVLEAMNRRSGSGGWRHSISADVDGTSGNVPIRVRNPNTNQIADEGVEAAAIEMHKMANDRPMRKVAGGITDDDVASIPQSTSPNYSFNQVEEMWWEGSLRQDRIAYARAHGSRRLSPEEQAKYGYETLEEALLYNRQAARDYLHNHHHGRMLQASVADERLTRKIAGVEDVRFTHKGAEYSIPLRNIRPHKGGKHRAAWQQFRDDIRRVYDEAGADSPQYMSGPKELLDAVAGRKSSENLDAALDAILNVVFTAPNDFMARSPALRQSTWNHLEEMIPLMNTQTRNQTLRAAEKARLPRSQIRRMKRTAEELPAGNSYRSAKQAEMVALDQGILDVKDMLYDVADRGQYADILRITNPFLEAFREVYKHWGVALARNPHYVPRSMQAYNSQREAGAIYEDPQTGEERFMYTGIGGMMRRFGIDPVHSQDPLDVNVNATGRLQGLNLIAQSIVPTFGPAMTLPASFAGVGDIDGQMGQFIRDVVFPFGEDESIEDAFMPAWMMNWWAWAKQDPEASMVWQSTRSNVTRMLASTGEYSADQHGMFTEAESEELQNDVDKITSRLMLLRGAAQFILPTGPDYEFEVRNPKDGSMHAIGELAREYHEIADEYDMDYDAATEEFIDRYGWDFMASTLPATSRATDQAPSMDHLFWRQENRDFVDTFPTVGMYFAPYADPDEWDIEAWMQAEVGPEGIRLDPRQMPLVGNNALGSQRMKQEKKRIEKLAEDKVSRGVINPDERDRFVDIMNSELEGEIMRQFPGYKQSVAGTIEDLDTQEEFEELRRAVQSDIAPDNEITNILREYFELFEEFSRIANEELGLSQREDRGLLSANDAAFLRDELEIYLRRKEQQVPELGAVMTSLLLPHLDFQSQEDRSSRDPVVESMQDFDRIRQETMYQMEELPPDSPDLPAPHRMDEIDEQMGTDAPARPEDIQEEGPVPNQPPVEPDTWNW